jgi:hypothetical protein
MSKPLDNVPEGLTEEQISNVSLTSFEVLDDGPPIKRMKLNDTDWTTTELTIQPETSDGTCFTVKNLGNNQIFGVNTSNSTITSNGTLYLADGTESNPSLTFATDTDLGVYRESENRFCVSAGGTKLLQVSSAGVMYPLRLEIPTNNGQALYVYNPDTEEDALTVDTVNNQVLFPLGSASVPGISFHGDSNTGIFSTADSFGITAGGIEQVTFTSSVATLQTPMIVDATNASALVIRQNGNTGDILTVDTITPKVQSDSNFIIDKTSTSALVVRKDANTGDILTVDTSTPLVRSDANTVIDNTSATAFVVRKDGATGDIFTVNTSTPSIGCNAQIVALSGSVSAPSLVCGDTDSGMYSSGDGNISIGTNGVQRLSLGTTATISQSNLVVDVTSTNAFLVRKNGDTGDIFTVSTATQSSVRSDAQMIVDVDNAAALVVRKDGALGDVLTVDTSTPKVQSDANLIVDNTSTTALVVRKDGNTGDVFNVDTSGSIITSGAQLILPNGTATDPALRFSASTGTGVYSSAANVLDFATNGTSRFFISANGDPTMATTSRGLFLNLYAGNFDFRQTVSGQPISLSTNGATGYIQFQQNNGALTIGKFRSNDCLFNTSSFRVLDSTGVTTYFTVNGSTGTTTFGGGIDFSSSSFKTTDTITLSTSPAASLVLNYIKIANTVTLTWEATTWSPGSTMTLDSLLTGDTIPSAFRSSGQVALFGQMVSGGSWTPISIRIQAAGSVDVVVATTGSSSYASGTYTLYGGGASYEL